MAHYLLAALAALLTSLALGRAEAHPARSQPARFDVTRADIRDFIDEVARRDSFDRGQISALIAKAAPQPRIIERTSEPAERVLTWWEYRERFVTEKRIAGGVRFWHHHRRLLERVATERGVAPEYIVAILGAETFYGRRTGHNRVLDALATLAFDYPARGERFRAELEQFLLLVREKHINPLTARGSYSGAMGAPQFLPSSYRRYAVDGNDDHRIDLWHDWDDIIASVANYFHEHGWQTAGPVLAEARLEPEAALHVDPHGFELNETLQSLAAQGVLTQTDAPLETPVLLIAADGRDGPAYRVGFRNFLVITHYNRSTYYAMAVSDLAHSIAARLRTADSDHTAALRYSHAPRPGSSTPRLLM